MKQIVVLDHDEMGQAHEVGRVTVSDFCNVYLELLEDQKHVGVVDLEAYVFGK